MLIQRTDSESRSGAAPADPASEISALMPLDLSLLPNERVGTLDEDEEKIRPKSVQQSHKESDKKLDSKVSWKGQGHLKKGVARKKEVVQKKEVLRKKEVARKNNHRVSKFRRGGGVQAQKASDKASDKSADIGDLASAKIPEHLLNSAAFLNGARNLSRPRAYTTNATRSYQDDHIQAKQRRLLLGERKKEVGMPQDDGPAEDDRHDANCGHSGSQMQIDEQYMALDGRTWSWSKGDDVVQVPATTAPGPYPAERAGNAVEREDVATDISKSWRFPSAVTSHALTRKTSSVIAQASPSSERDGAISMNPASYSDPRNVNSWRSPRAAMVVSPTPMNSPRNEHKDREYHRPATKVPLITISKAANIPEGRIIVETSVTLEAHSEISSVVTNPWEGIEESCLPYLPVENHIGASANNYPARISQLSVAGAPVGAAKKSVGENGVKASSASDSNNSWWSRSGALGKITAPADEPSESEGDEPRRSTNDEPAEAEDEGRYRRGSASSTSAGECCRCGIMAVLKWFSRFWFRRRESKARDQDTELAALARIVIQANRKLSEADRGRPQAGDGHETDPERPGADQGLPGVDQGVPGAEAGVPGADPACLESFPTLVEMLHESPDPSSQPQASEIERPVDVKGKGRMDRMVPEIPPSELRSWETEGPVESSGEASVARRATVREGRYSPVGRWKPGISFGLVHQTKEEVQARAQTIRRSSAGPSSMPRVGWNLAVRTDLRGG